MTASPALNQPKMKKQSRLDQVLSSRPAIDHDLQPSPTPSIATCTPQKRRNQQLHSLASHFTPTKNTRSISTTITSTSSAAKKSTTISPSSSKKQKTTTRIQSTSGKKPTKIAKSVNRSYPAEEDDEQDELLHSDSDSIGLDQDNNSNNLHLPATPASSISTSSESPFNLMELIQAGKVKETPRRGRRVAKVDMGWISPSTQLKNQNQMETLPELGGDRSVSKEKATGKGKKKEAANQINADDESTPLSSRRPIQPEDEEVRIPSWTAPSVTSTPSKRKAMDEASSPPLPTFTPSKFTATNAYGVTLIDSQGWAAAGVLGKGERVPYLGSPDQDAMIGLGVGQSDEHLVLSQNSSQSEDLFNSTSDQVAKFQLPSQLRPSYDPLSGFSFNKQESGSGSPAPLCLQPQEAGRGEGLGTKLIPFQVSGIGRMALHEDLIFNFNFLNDNIEGSDSSNSQGSAPLHRYSDAEGSSSGSSRTSGTSVSTNLTSIGTPGPGDNSSAPNSGPSPSFSLCSHFPASEPRTPMNAGVKTAAPTQETTHQALAAVLNFGAQQESTKEGNPISSLKLKNVPSAETIKKLHQIRELVEKAREANRKRKSEKEQPSSNQDDPSASKRPKHSLRFVGVEMDHAASILPSLAWPDSDSASPWSFNVHTNNAGRAEKESIIKWLEMKPSSTLSLAGSEYEIDAEQRAELEENHLQWSQHPMVAKALRDRARKEEAKRILELEMAREQRARDRAYGRASARSHAKKASTHYPKVRRAARASIRQRARKELTAHPDAVDGISASKHIHKPSGAYLIQPPAPVYNPSPEPQPEPQVTTSTNTKGKRPQRISIKSKRQSTDSKKAASKGKGKKSKDSSSSTTTTTDALFGCSCGRGDDEEDTPPMVQCDSCNKWHHLPCIGVESEDQLDAEWYCDECCNPDGRIIDDEDASSVATDPLDLELEQRSPASESSFNVLSTPKTHSSTPTSASNRFINGHRLAEPVFAQPTESPMRNMRQPLAASALALAPSPPMMSSSRYKGPPSHVSQESRASNPHFPHSSIYASPGYHPHAHQPQDERYGRGRVRAERIGGWLNMENNEAQGSQRRKDEEEDLNEPGSPLARKSTPIKRSLDLFSSQSQESSRGAQSRRVSNPAQPISRPRTPTTPRIEKETQELRSPVMGLSTPSRHARLDKRSNHQFSDDEDHVVHRDDVFSTPSRLMGGSASWGYSRGTAGGPSSRAGSQTPGKSSIPSFSRDLFGESSGGGHHRRDSSHWGLSSALRTPSRDVVSRGSGSFTPNLVDHSGGYSVGLPSLVFSSGGLDMDSHPPSYSNHPSSSGDYNHQHPTSSSSSSASRAWQLQSPTSTTRAGAARARQSSASYPHSLGLGGMLRTPELRPTFNRGTRDNNSSIRGTSHHHSQSQSRGGRERERSRSPSPIKRSGNGTLPALKKTSNGKAKRRGGGNQAQDSEDEEDRSDHPPTSSSPFPPTPTFEGQIKTLESSMGDSAYRIPTSAQKLANLSDGGVGGLHSTPISKSFSQPSGLNFTRTPPSEESNRLALAALLDSPADFSGHSRKRNTSGLGIGLALDDVLDWS